MAEVTYGRTVDEAFALILQANDEKEGSIISQLCTVMENISRNGVYSQNELKQSASLFCEYSIQEQSKIMDMLAEKLVEFCYSPEISYQKMFKVAYALNILNKLENVSGKKSNSNKIQLCKLMYEIVSDFRLENFLKVAKLLDS